VAGPASSRPGWDAFFEASGVSMRVAGVVDPAMHILLTDILSCPRCGPGFGLIVLAEGIEDRRVREGSLGCANCRQSFPVLEGVADLRHSASPPFPAEVPGGAVGEGMPDTERSFRLAALLGATGSQSAVLVVEPTGRLAPGVAAVQEGTHVVGMSGSPPLRHASEGVLSRILAGGRIPVRSHSLRGVAFAGVDTRPLLGEAARILMPRGRLVIDPAPAGLSSALRQEGFLIRLEQDGVVVADAPEAG